VTELHLILPLPKYWLKRATSSNFIFPMPVAPRELDRRQSVPN
jgi:hypothetical protein